MRDALEVRAPQRLGTRALQRLVRGADPALLAEEPPDGPLARHFVEAEAQRRAETGRPYKGATRASRRHAFLYALVRALDAEHVVETGVANGFTSAYLLAALERSGHGTLHSIDLPFFDDPATGAVTAAVTGAELETLDEYTPVAPGRAAGWIVPDELRPRWDLRLGDAKELLPPLLAELGQIDLFFHDSTHTREHILWELELAWPHVRANGVLAADDVFLRGHEALPEFARGKGLDFVTYGGVGYVRKR